jgi:hypothetical protein
MVQSLIVPAVEYQAAKRYQVATEKAEYRIRFGRLIEQQPDWVWTAIEPLDGSARTPSPVTSGPTTVTGMTTVTGTTVSQSGS